jgi:lactate permease
MVVLEKPAYIAAPITLAVTSVVALSFWRMDVSWFNASLVRGGLISLEIIFIVIGAFLLITVLKRGNAFSHIKYGISMISKDVRIQVILLAWFFVAFIEGVSGFGTPAMIVAPLMVVMGFTPLASVVATLIGDSVSASFGAVGVPMTIGIGQGVSPEQAMIIGPEYISQTYITTSLLHVLIGMCIPFIILIDDRHLFRDFINLFFYT